MEIKCKVSFALPEELMKALDITDDTPVIASISDGRVVVEFINEEDEDFEEDFSDDFTEDDLYDDEDCCCEDGCECCEYYCHRCGECILD